MPCSWVKHTYKSLGFLPNLLASIRKAKKDFQPDLLHIHQPLIGLLASMVFHRGTPKVYHFHSLWKDEKMSHAKTLLGQLYSHLKGWIESFALRRMDHFIVLSDFSRQKLLKAVPHANITVIPGAVDTGRFNNAVAQTTKEPEAGLEIVSVRRLDPRMGLDLLLKAVALFKEKYPEEKLTCTIIGEGRQRDELENIITTLELQESVHLKGRVEEDELVRAMTQAHLSILPTRELEGFGVSVIESFSAGTPVMATSAGALSEFERFPDVFHCVGDANPENLLNGLRWAYDNWKSTDLKLSCKKVVQENFSEDVVSQKLLSFYNDVLS